jgi:SNF2 family DNA or RNA helicase
MASQVILKAIMLRRKKDHILNGKPILQLPDRTVNVVKCDFDPEEYAFYMALESKMSTEVDKLMNAGEAQKNYTNILVMLLRLRQGNIPTRFIICQTDTLWVCC